MVDKEINDIQEIRRLLSLYYEGSTSRDDERRLGELLRSAAELPADLAAERRFFLAMESGVDGLADTFEMPADVEAHISGRVETEMRRSRTKGILRSIAATAIAAAACIALVLTIGLPIREENPASGRRASSEESTSANVAVEAGAKQETPGLAGASGMQTDTALIASSLTVEKSIPRQPRRRKETPKPETSMEKNPAVTVEVRARRGEPGRMRLDEFETEEQQAFIAANYRVVEDPTEAFAIINSVMARLDDNMMEEERIINTLSDRYDEIETKLY